MSDKFSLSVRNAAGITIIDLQGELDAYTAPLLEEAVQKSITEKRYNILVNFKELRYIASAGIGVFMAFIQETRDNGGDIKMCNMISKIYKSFDNHGFTMFYEILQHEDEAIKKFK